MKKNDEQGEDILPGDLVHVHANLRIKVSTWKYDPSTEILIVMRQAFAGDNVNITTSMNTGWWVVASVNDQQHEFVFKTDELVKLS